MKKFWKFSFAFVLCIILSASLVACDKNEEPNASDSECSHNYGEWVLVKESTCAENGLEERSCSCGDKETRQIPTLDHVEETIKGCAATCTETGLTDGVKCSVCQTVITEQTEIPNLGGKHNSGDDGICTVCGEEVFTKGLVFNYNTQGTAYLVHRFSNPEAKHVIIPSEYEGLPVISIEASAFADCTNITSVTISDRIQNIGVGAFSGCKNLTHITIGEKVTLIDDFAFQGCLGLTSITISGRVSHIGASAFVGCTNLESMTFSNRLKLMKHGALKGCTSLTRIEFQGTMAEWKEVTKMFDWDSNTGEYTVYCTDGNIQKTES